MLQLLVLAPISLMLTAVQGAPASDSGQSVQESRNGQFLARYYPPGALKRGEQGKVAFRIMIEPDGSIGSCDVTESSGFAALDKETCEIMVHYARLKPVRNSDGRAIRATQSGFIVWRLPEGRTQMASTSAVTMPKPDKIICKREATTGSLVKKTKQCMSAADWKKQEQMWKDEMDRLQGRGHFEDEGAQ